MLLLLSLHLCAYLIQLGEISEFFIEKLLFFSGFFLLLGADAEKRLSISALKSATCFQFCEQSVHNSVNLA